MGITRLRLARMGLRNRPFYHIVAIDSRKARNAQPIEQIGTYDPLPSTLDGAKEVRFKVDRIKYWLSVGAQPSDRVAYLLWRAGLVPAPPIHYTPTKWLPRKEVKEAAKKGFHTMSAAALASGAAPLFSAVLPRRPALSAFSGLFSRPASASPLCR